MAAPVFPARLRTWCYGAGVVLGLGVAPSLLAADLTVLATVAGSLAGAANALAFGYRPTKPPAGWTDDAPAANG